MKTWLNSLTLRERNLVIYGSLIAGLILFWLLIGNPLYKKHVKLTKDIENKANSLELMKGQSLQVKQLRKNNNTSSPIKASGNPQQLVEKALQTWRLKPALQRMQSQGTDSVRLTLKDADANRLMRCLHDLEHKYALSIENLSIVADKDPGLADVRLTVKR